jgi:hypothetical protein
MTPAARSLLRPQPLGLAPFPASHLLLPASDDPRAAAALSKLVAGDFECDVPDEWQFFADFLLDNVAGARFVLESLARGRPRPISSADSVEALLLGLAERLFGDLVVTKTEELLEQHSGYQSV